MSDEERSARVEIDGASVRIDGDEGEKVRIGPGGLHVKDGESEVKVSWAGVRVVDGRTRLSISFWKPLVGCGAILVLLAAIVTAVVVGIVKLMM